MFSYVCGVCGDKGEIGVPVVTSQEGEVYEVRE